MEINARTFRAWTRWLEEHLEDKQGSDRILVLVDGYFAFASEHRNLWSAIYEHRVPDPAKMADALVIERKTLTSVITREVASVLPDSSPEAIASLASPLIAAVHGHCAFLLGGTFALMGIETAQDLAAARVLEILHANGATLG